MNGDGKRESSKICACKQEFSIRNNTSDLNISNRKKRKVNHSELFFQASFSSKREKQMVTDFSYVNEKKLLFKLPKI